MRGARLVDDLKCALPKPPGEIVDQRLAILVEDLGADRHFENDVLAVGAVAVLAHAVGALGRLEMLLIAIVDQRVEAVDRLDDDVAAAAAVTAARPAELDELLAAKRHATVSTVAGADIDLGFVEEFHRLSVSQRRSVSNNAQAGRSRVAA